MKVSSSRFWLPSLFLAILFRSLLLFSTTKQQVVHALAPPPGAHPRDDVVRADDFHGVSVAQVVDEENHLRFDHYMIIEMLIHIVDMTDDDWERLADYLRVSLYASVGNNCGRDDGIKIDAVHFNPDDVPFADGLSNYTSELANVPVRLSVPVLLEMSCVECDPYDVVLLLGRPDLPGADRRELHLQQDNEQEQEGMEILSHEDLQDQQSQHHFESDSHRRLSGIGHGSLLGGRGVDRFFCDPGSTFDVTWDFYTKVTANPQEFGVDLVEDIYYVADLVYETENCWVNHTIQDFEYTMYFTAFSQADSMYTEEALEIYGEYFKRSYNELNARNWRVCDPQGRIVTDAELKLPEGTWMDGTEITFEVTFTGYCVDCEPEGCLLNAFPRNGWPAVLEELPDRPTLRGSSTTRTGTGTGRESITRDQSIDRDTYRLDDTNNDAETSGRGDESYTRESVTSVGDGDSQTRARDRYDTRRRRRRRLDHDHGRRLGHGETLGECLCNMYPDDDPEDALLAKSRPTMQDFSDQLSEGMNFGSLDIGFLFSRPLTMWEKDPGICNTCCGFDLSDPIPDGMLFDSSDDYFNNPDDPIYGLPVNCWDVSQVTNFRNIWFQFPGFNEDLSCWDVSKGIDFGGMFIDSPDFNQPLHTWDMSNAENIDAMFEDAAAFNQDIGGWDVSKVVFFEQAFSGATSFGYSLNSWNTSNGETMNAMFFGIDYNLPLDNWDVSKVTTFSSMFRDSTFNQPIGNWNPISCTNFFGMFLGSLFNQDISDWEFTDMPFILSSMFELSAFNQNISGWDVSSCLGFDYMFYEAEFNQPLPDWRPISAETFEGMFAFSSYDQSIANWELPTGPGDRYEMDFMFAGNEVFNQDLNNWDVSYCITFFRMFADAISFNSPLSNWQTTRALDFGGMFSGAMSFNQPVDNFFIGGALALDYMFFNAIMFNQNLSSWSPVEAQCFTSMFQGAEMFNQDLCHFNAVVDGTNLDLEACPNPLADMFEGTMCDPADDPTFNVGPYCAVCVL